MIDQVSVFYKPYVRKVKRHNKLNDQIDAEIKAQEKKLEQLRERKSKINYPHWNEHFLMSLAKEICERLKIETYEIYGPFGLRCDTSLHFIKNGKSLSVSFIPDGDEGELLVLHDKNRDHNKDPNGFSSKTSQLPETVSEIIEMMEKEAQAN